MDKTLFVPLGDKTDFLGITGQITETLPQVKDRTNSSQF